MIIADSKAPLRVPYCYTVLFSEAASAACRGVACGQGAWRVPVLSDQAVLKAVDVNYFGVAAVRKRVQTAFACRLAGAAADALMRNVAYNGSFQQPFRVVAPAAAQRTSLEEHRRAYGRAVMNGKALNVEDRAFHRRLTSAEPCGR